MKIKLLLIASLLTSPLPVLSQQTNIYSVCTDYQENYSPGYYDRYGNYIQGSVNTQRVNVQCGTGTYYRPNVGYSQNNNEYRRSRCSAARTTLGGLVGGGIAAAVSKKNSWKWSIPLGAVLGSGVANVNCY